MLLYYDLVLIVYLIWFAQAPTIPNINYKPSVNCSYSALVNRIKETQSAGRDLTLLDNLDKKDRPRLENPIYNPSYEDGT